MRLGESLRSSVSRLLMSLLRRVQQRSTEGWDDRDG